MNLRSDRNEEDIGYNWGPALGMCVMGLLVLSAALFVYIVTYYMAISANSNYSTTAPSSNAKSIDGQLAKNMTQKRNDQKRKLSPSIVAVPGGASTLAKEEALDMLWLLWVSELVNS